MVGPGFVLEWSTCSLEIVRGVVVALGLCIGCSRDGEIEPTAVHDATADVLDDAIVIDAAAPRDVWWLPEDAPPAPFAGSWSNVLGLPTCPNIWLANSPATDLVDSWTACSSGRSGCFRMATPWSEGGADRVGGAMLVGARPTDAPIFDYYREFPPLGGSAFSDRGQELVQSPLHESVFGYSFLRGPCTAGMYPGPTRVLLLARVPDNPSRTARVVVVDYDDPATPIDAFDLPYDDVVSGGGHPTFVGVGARRLFLGTGGDGPHSIAVIDLSTHAIVKKVTAGAPPIEVPKPVPGGAIATWWGKPYGIAFIDDDGGVEKLHTPSTASSTACSSTMRRRTWCGSRRDMRSTRACRWTRHSRCGLRRSRGGRPSSPRGS